MISFMVPIPKKLEVIIQKVYVGDRLVAETPEDEMFVFCTLPKKRGSRVLLPLDDEELGCVNMGLLKSHILPEEKQLSNMGVICGPEECLSDYHNIQICGKAKDPVDLARQLAEDVGSLMIEYGFFNVCTYFKVLLIFSGDIRIETTINNFPDPQEKCVMSVPLTSEESRIFARHYELEIRKINQMYEEQQREQGVKVENQEPQEIMAVTDSTVV